MKAPSIDDRAISISIGNVRRGTKLGVQRVGPVGLRGQKNPRKSLPSEHLGSKHKQAVNANNKPDQAAVVITAATARTRCQPTALEQKCHNESCGTRKSSKK